MRCAATTCHRLAFRVTADVPLCLDHLQGLREALETAGATSESELIAALKAQAPELTYQGTSLVYYLGHPVKPLVKIGVSQNLHKRVATLSKANGRLSVLAVEPGGYYDEKARHRQFRSLRLPHSEWFRQEPILMEHIARIVAERGPARCNCRPHGQRKCPIGR